MAGISRRNIDFTKGNIYKSLLLFAIPIMLGEVFQNLYHSTDSVVLGNFAGESALAAVSVCSTLTNMLIGFCNGMSVGGTVVVSKAFGSGERQRLENSVKYTYSFAIVLGLAISAFGLVFSPVLVRISNVNAEIYTHALTYMRIYSAGLLFTIVYNTSAGILRGMGDMRTPFVILVITCSLNIVLDLLFCAVLNLGIAGVAWATVISQLLSVIISYSVIHRRLGFNCIDIKDTFRNGRKTLSEALDVGISAGLQGSLISFSNIFIWRYINRFSTAVVAGIGIGQRIDKFVSLPTTAFGTSITTFAGQNIGAGNRDRIKAGVRKAMVLSVGITMAAGLVIYPLAGTIAAAFNRNPEVVQTAVGMIHILVPFYALNAIRMIFLGMLRAHHRSKFAMVLTLSGMIGVRQIYLAFFMATRPSIQVIYWGYPIGWVFAFLFVGSYYFMSRKKMQQGL